MITEHISTSKCSNVFCKTKCLFVFSKLYNLIMFASFLMLLAHIFGTADIDSGATTDFVIRLSKLSFRYER